MRVNMVRQTEDFWHRELTNSEKWDANDDQSKHTTLHIAPPSTLNRYFGTLTI